MGPPLEGMGDSSPHPGLGPKLQRAFLALPPEAIPMSVHQPELTPFHNTPLWAVLLQNRSGHSLGLLGHVISITTPPLCYAGLKAVA